MSLNLNILKSQPTLKSQPQIVFRDLHLDIHFEYTNNNQIHKKNEIMDIVGDVNDNAIKNSLFNIFSTSPGQKILNPEFGLVFNQWLFTNMSENGALVIKQTIYEQIQKYEPRVILDEVLVVPNYEQNEYHITIRYNRNREYIMNLTEAGIVA